MKYFVLILICAAINSLDDTNEDYRKQYGFSFHKNCGNYFITFKCLTACKSMGFQVFRLDYKCKCTCHELKTTTILPAFVWRTNGTTRKVPETFSPKLYAIVGTMSPSPMETDKATEFDRDKTAAPSKFSNNSVETTDELSHVTEPPDTNSNAPAYGTDSSTIATNVEVPTTVAS